ncbi:MAG: hypothetical protein MJK04_16895, partial [Psychrosphaera sp.]|nr:hypothetical protein [Psychrosphaera sp.]
MVATPQWKNAQPAVVKKVLKSILAFVGLVIIFNYWKEMAVPGRVYVSLNLLFSLLISFLFYVKTKRNQNPADVKIPFLNPLCQSREYVLLRVKALFLTAISLILILRTFIEIIPWQHSINLAPFGLFFVLVTLFILVFISNLEYNWLIRKGRFITQESSLSKRFEFEGYDMASENGDKKQSTKAYRKKRIKLRRLYRLLIEQTFGNILFKFWLPVFSVKINLGFDIIEHKTIISAMLTGVKREYIKQFIVLRSPRVWPYKMAYLVLLLWLTFSVSAFLFDLAPASVQNRPSDNIPAEVTKSNSPKAMAIRILQAINLDGLLPLLYQDVFIVPITMNDNEAKLVNETLLPGLIGTNKTTITCKAMQHDRPPTKEKPLNGAIATSNTDSNFVFNGTGQTDPKEINCSMAKNSSIGLHLYVYHLIVGLLLYLILKQVFRQRSILPYKNNLRKIDQLLSELSQTVEHKEKQQAWKFSNLVTAILPGGDKQKTTTSEPSDSRLIELKCLALLEDLQKSKISFFGIDLSLPNPEITFIFDELDKLADKGGTAERENTAQL